MQLLVITEKSNYLLTLDLSHVAKDKRIFFSFRPNTDQKIQRYNQITFHIDRNLLDLMEIDPALRLLNEIFEHLHKLPTLPKIIVVDLVFLT